MPGGAAPLGRVPAEVVDAAFYSYADGEVARRMARWETTTPEAAHAARQRGCVAALRRILGDLVVTPEAARAAEASPQGSTTAATEVNLSRRARCAVRVGRPARSTVQGCASDQVKDEVARRAFAVTR